MANPHINYATFKSRFGDLGITEWTKYNYLSNYNFGLPAQTEVPSEYLELESITGKSTTYIKIPFQFNTPDFRIELESAITETSDRTALSFVNDGNGYALTYGRGFSGKIFGVNNNIVEDGYLVFFNTSTDKLKAVITHTTFTVDGANYDQIGSTGTFPSYEDVAKLLLFKINEASTTGGDGITIYKVVVYEDGFPVLNLKPVRRLSDGVIGMYDTVSGQFFGNAGTGTFTAGPMKQRYVRVEYVQFNGNDVINTGLTTQLSKTYIQDTDIQFTSFGTGAPQFNGADYGYYFGVGYNSDFTATSGDGLNPRKGADIERHHFVQSVSGQQQYNWLYIDGEKYRSSRTLTWRDGLPLYIGGIDNAYYCNEKIYNYSIYKDGVLLRDFVPVYDLVSEKYGLYDLVEGKFYGSVNGLLTGPWGGSKKLDSLTWFVSARYPGGFSCNLREYTTIAEPEDIYIIDMSGRYYYLVKGVDTYPTLERAIAISLPNSQVPNELRLWDTSMIDQDILTKLNAAWVLYK